MVHYRLLLKKPRIDLSFSISWSISLSLPSIFTLSSLRHLYDLVAEYLLTILCSAYLEIHYSPILLHYPKRATAHSNFTSWHLDLLQWYRFNAIENSLNLSLILSIQYSSELKYSFSILFNSHSNIASNMLLVYIYFCALHFRQRLNISAGKINMLKPAESPTETVYKKSTSIKALPWKL